jgi:RNA polymerase sigma-70 factor (ECF subfamily)
MIVPDERGLIERLTAGDRSAFQELVEQYKKRIYGLAFNMIRNHHDAEDASQEVFIKAFRSFHTFRKDARLGSWLYQITVNTCRDYYRRKPREAAAFVSLSEADAPAVETSAWSDSPEKNAEARLLQARIDLVLTTITEQERAAFVLRHYEELDLKSIAEVMEISVGSVKSYLFRGIRKIRRELAGFQGPSPAEVNYE